MKPLIRLAKDDNVAIALQPLAVDTRVVLDDVEFQLQTDIKVGHKVAVCDIAARDKVRRNGVKIGSATSSIAVGEHVHLHNLKSDYIPTLNSHYRDREAPSMMRGYARHDGRKGIRNTVVVAYLVECAHHVAREICLPYRHHDVHLIGFPGCYPSAYANQMMRRLCTHPNVGAVLLVSLGCENFDRKLVEEAVAASGRPLKTLIIQEAGGTVPTLNEGQAWVKKQIELLSQMPTCSIAFSDLTVGAICGGSDTFSGITGNPAVGRAFDRFAELGATAIFEETGELIGCEQHMIGRAETPQVAQAIDQAMRKAAEYYQVMGHSSFSLGNAEGGLTTIEEKSLGAYAKSGCVPIRGVIKPGDIPTQAGVYLLDVIPDGQVRFGFPNINDNAEITELIACGCT